VLASATLAVVPPERAGVANGASNFRQLGYALELPVFATVVAWPAGPGACWAGTPHRPRG
jgi:hypothetical protein